MTSDAPSTHRVVCSVAQRFLAGSLGWDTAQLAVGKMSSELVDQKLDQKTSFVQRKSQSQTALSGTHFKDVAYLDSAVKNICGFKWKTRIQLETNINNNS